MGSRKQLRANLKQQDGATSAARAHGGGLLGDAACEDLRSGSIIVVISPPRREPRAPRQSAPTSLLLRLTAASQGNRERATGHGYTAARRRSAPAAAQLFIHLKAWTREDVHLSLSAACSNVYSTCSIDERMLNTRERALSNQLFIQLPSINQSLYQTLNK